MQISSQTPIYSNASQISNNSSQNNQVQENAQQTNIRSTDEVSISMEGMLKNLTMQKVTESSFLNYVPFGSNRYRDSENYVPPEESWIPVDVEFFKGSPEEAMNNILKDKMEHSSQYITNILHSLNGKDKYGEDIPNLSLEEKSVMRELTIKQAEQFASTHLDENDTKNFMDYLKTVKSNLELSDKGYEKRMDGSISLQYARGQSVSLNAFIGKYFSEDDFNRFVDGKMSKSESSDFNKYLGSNLKKWSEQYFSDASKKEKEVSDIISKVSSWAGSFNFDLSSQPMLDEINKYLASSKNIGKMLASLRHTETFPY